MQVLGLAISRDVPAVCEILVGSPEVFEIPVAPIYPRGIGTVLGSASSFAYGLIFCALGETHNEHLRPCRHLRSPLTEGL
jgi:hypothetical protein